MDEEENELELKRDEFEEKKPKVDVIRAVQLMHQRISLIPTLCGKCKKQITFKLLDEYHLDFTTKCDCGVSIYRKMKKDDFHKEDYWLKQFIPKHQYIKNYKDLSPLEKEGMQKKVLGNKIKYVKQ